MIILDAVARPAEIVAGCAYLATANIKKRRTDARAQASVPIGLLQADGMGALTRGMFDQNECGTIHSGVAINAGACAEAAASHPIVAAVSLIR